MTMGARHETSITPNCDATCNAEIRRLLCPLGMLNAGDRSAPENGILI